MITLSPEVLTGIEHAVWLASKVCLEIYDRDFRINYKKDSSPVTEADLAVNQIITDALKRLTPDIPVISEEALLPWEERKDFQTYWLIDPIDGTKEFVKKNDQFTINLGLIDDGKPTMGWVLAPVYQELYYGGPMLGYTTLESKKSGILSYPTAAKISNSVDRLVVACSSSHRKPEDEQFIFNLSTDFFVKTLPIGSTLKIVKIASGEVNLYTRLSGINDWDLAAAHAVLLGAGGGVTTLDGKDLVYNTEEQKLAPFICHCATTFNPAIYAL